MKEPDDSRPAESEVSFHLSYRALVAIMIFVAVMVGFISPEAITAAVSSAIGR